MERFSLERIGGPREETRERLTPGPLQHGVCSTGCRMSDILAQSDHAAKAEVDTPPQIRVRKKRHADVQHPKNPHWSWTAKLGRAEVFHTP